MAKIVDKLWNWGHLEGSHNKGTGMDCKMTPEEFAEVYGIKNAFVVSYGGNIQPPFAPFAQRFSGLKEVKWSVVGNETDPLANDRLGYTKDILDVLSVAGNITGGVVDDFFSPERMERYTPEVLKEIREAFHEKGLDFWCVLYGHELDFDFDAYLDCFDGITFWIWECPRIPEMQTYLDKLAAKIKDKPVMLGIYLWSYSKNERKPMDPVLFEMQLKYYFQLLRAGKIEGIIFCSSTVGDADLESNRILKRYIRQYGELEIDGVNSLP